jgi:hypothetical protein
MWLLDKVYAEPEADEALERAKQEARAAVYASHYLDFATKYFGHADNANSRRCYVEAIRREPRLASAPRVLRRLLASFLPRSLYEGAKRAVRRRRN